MAATEEQLAKMEKGEYSKKLQAAYDKLTQAGAHYVIDSINDLPGVIEDINRRLACGEKPWKKKWKRGEKYIKYNSFLLWNKK